MSWPGQFRSWKCDSPVLFGTRTPGLMLAVTLSVLFPAVAPTAGDAPPVSVRFLVGQVIEIPTAFPDTLVVSELVPDQPFLDPIPPMSLEAFRDFYSRLGLRFELTPQQVKEISERASKDESVKAHVSALLARASAMLDQPPPRYAPCRQHLSESPREQAELVQRQASALAEMRHTCALAFALTGDERFARKAWELLLAAIEHFYTYGVFRMPYSWDSPLDTGYEIHEAAASYDLIAHWEGLRPLDHALLLTYLRRLGIQAAYAVELSPVIGSQQAVWTCSLGSLALYAPSAPEAPHWRSLVEERMHSVMADFMPDGGEIESDPEQHAFALEHLVRYARVGELNGAPGLLSRRWGESRVSIVSALDWLARTATPLGETPGVNDSRHIPLASYGFFLDAANMLRRGDWLRAARATPQVAAPPHTLDADLLPRDPAYTSVLLPDTGWAVMRDGWDPTDSYLLLDFGRHGGAHGHLDKLSFELYARGQPWVLDAGAAPDYAVHAVEHEGWHRQTIAHNTVLVDGDSQQPTDGTLVGWYTCADCDVAAGEHTGYPDFIHRRTILHPRHGYFLIFDELVNSADRERSAEWLLHVNGYRQSGTVGRFVFWREREEGLSVMWTRGQGLRGARIGEGLCGGCDGLSASWLGPPGSGHWTPGEPGWAYIPFIGLKKALPAHASDTYCVVLTPFQGREPTLRVDVDASDQAYVIQVRTPEVRDRWLIRARNASPGLVRYRGLVTDGRYAFVREIGDQVTAMELVDGETLSFD